MPRLFALCALAVAAVLPARIEAQGACRLTTADSTWIASSLQGWTRIAAREAGAAVRRPPTLVLFDKRCAHTLEPVRGVGRAGLEAAHLRFGVSSTSHAGKVALPDGSRIPASLTSYAAPQPDGRMFFVMSLPAIWVESGRGPRAERLATAVFMHEFTHTQSAALGARVDSLIARGMPADSDDDVIQKRFATRPGHTKAFELERDTLFAAAAAPTIGAARVLATSAMRAIDARRARWYTGRDSVYAAAEDVFLSLEGMGQWLAYKWLVDPQGGAMPEAEALPAIRRGARWWSQDEGLALMLVASRLSDRVPMLLFRERPATILEILRELTLTSPPLASPWVRVELIRGTQTAAEDSAVVLNAFRAGLLREKRARLSIPGAAIPITSFAQVRYWITTSVFMTTNESVFNTTLVDVESGAILNRATLHAGRADIAIAVDSLGAKLARLVETHALRSP